MTKLWVGRNGFIDDSAGDDTFDYSIFEVATPCTLLRSMVWVTWQGYNLYDIGANGIPLGPLGYAFGDMNSRNNHNEFPPNNSPGNDKTELVAYDEVAPCYTGLGWPPNVTSTVSGSVNDINSSATVHETWNLNTFMYTSARSFVDSQAQRIFDAEPEFRLVLQFFGGITTFVQGKHHVNITIRQLFSF
jgi:hypothetical protein